MNKKIVNDIGECERLKSEIYQAVDSAFKYVSSNTDSKS